MLGENRKSNLMTKIVFRLTLILALFLTAPALGLGQNSEDSQNAVNTAAVNEERTADLRTGKKSNDSKILVPVLKSYKEIKIGMPADQVRDKLGKPKIESDKDLFYQFTEDESAQILFDADKKVRVISMMYMDRNGNFPKPADVFGAYMQITSSEDGSIYKMVRYPAAGYVVVYSRTVGDNPMIVVTMQKI